MNQLFRNGTEIRTPVQSNRFVDGVELSENLGTVVSEFEHITLGNELTTILYEFVENYDITPVSFSCPNTCLAPEAIAKNSRSRINLAVGYDPTTLRHSTIWGF